MIKSMVAATAALAIAGSSFVYAQQRYGGDEGDGGRHFEHHYRPSLEDRKAFAEARIAALKAGLTLTPDQEKNWAPFEHALRDPNPDNPANNAAANTRRVHVIM